MGIVGQENRADHRLLMDRLLLRTTEAAEVLGLSPATTRKMIADGTLPSIIVNRGSRRVPVDQLREWVRRQCE